MTTKAELEAELAKTEKKLARTEKKVEQAAAPEPPAETDFNALADQLQTELEDEADDRVGASLSNAAVALRAVAAAKQAAANQAAAEAEAAAVAAAEEA